MRRFLFKITVFVVGFALCYICFFCLVAFSTGITHRVEGTIIGNKNEWGSTFFRSADLNEWINTNEKKGLVLGSSTAYRNIDPRILSNVVDINFFNNGSSGQPPVVSELMLDYILERTKLKCVIIDLYQGLWEMENGDEACNDWVINSKEYGILQLNLAIHSNSLSLINKYIYFSLKNELPYFVDHLNPEDRNGEYINGTGFVCSPESRAENKEHNYGFERVEFFDNENLKSLPRMIETCKLNGVQVFLNISPVIGKEIDITNLLNLGVPIIEITVDEIGIKAFYDSHHMICSGAKIYSTLMASQLLNVID